MKDLQTRDLAWWRLYQSLPILARPGLRAILIGLLAWLVAALAHELKELFIPDFRQGFVFTLLRSLAYGLATAVAGLFTLRGATNSDDPRIRRRRLRTQTLKTGLSSGLAYGLVTGLAYWLKYGVAYGVAGGLIYTLVAGLAYGLAARIAGLYATPGTPMRTGIHLSGRGRLLVRHVLTGAAAGLATGIGLGGVIGIPYALAVGQWIGLAAGGGIGSSFGLVLGVVFGLANYARIPVESDEAASPRRSLHADRSLILFMTFLLAVAFAVLFPLTIGVTGLLLGGPTDFEALFGFGLMGLLIGILTGPLTGAWTLYTLARVWLALRGRLPWHLMSFLEDMRRIGVLRQDGANYQFRHSRVQTQLGRRRA